MDGRGYEGDGLFKGKKWGGLAWQVWQYGMKSGSVVCGEIREFWGITRVYLATMVCVFVCEVQLRSRQVHS